MMADLNLEKRVWDCPALWGPSGLPTFAACTELEIEYTGQLDVLSTVADEAAAERHNRLVLDTCLPASSPKACA